MCGRHLRSSSEECNRAPLWARQPRLSQDGRGARLRTSSDKHAPSAISSSPSTALMVRTVRSAEVAARFGLISAGEIAREADILPGPEGEATRSADRCFDDWLSTTWRDRACRRTGRHRSSPALLSSSTAPRASSRWDLGMTVRTRGLSIALASGGRCPERLRVHRAARELGNPDVCAGLDVALSPRLWQHAAF